MVTVTIDEITLNATRAALDERARRLKSEVAELELAQTYVWYGRSGPALEDAQRSLVWNIAALHETELAREFFSEVQVVDHPVDATWTSA